MPPVYKCNKLALASGDSVVASWSARFMKKHHTPATSLKTSPAVKAASIAAQAADKKVEAAEKFALLAKTRFKAAKKAHKLARKAAKRAFKEANAAHERLDAAQALAFKSKKKKAPAHKAPLKAAKVSIKPKAHLHMRKHRALEITLPPIPPDFVPPEITPNPADLSSQSLGQI